MEQLVNNNGVLHHNDFDQEDIINSKFIESNTSTVTLDEIRDKHVIPVFVKDNVPTISQADFISTAREIVEELSGKRSSYPAVRVSHPIKGRIFSARNKKVGELEEWEKTIYYERLAFISDLPDIVETVNGKELTMSFGGVKAYSQDNLNSTQGSIQRFKFFIGFKVKVCTNLCVWTDGYSGEIKARNISDLSTQIYDIVSQYNSVHHIDMLNKLSNYTLSEHQFATLVGRARMYNHLPLAQKKDIPKLLIPDSQISSITKAYYQDKDFSPHNGDLSLWNLYNMFTDAVKSSYIDSFLDRNSNAFEFANGISKALNGTSNYDWFLN